MTKKTGAVPIIPSPEILSPLDELINSRRAQELGSYSDRPPQRFSDKISDVLPDYIDVGP